MKRMKSYFKFIDNNKILQTRLIKNKKKNEIFIIQIRYKEIKIRLNIIKIFKNIYNRDIFDKATL